MNGTNKTKTYTHFHVAFVCAMVFLQIITLYIFIHSNIRPSQEIIELALARKRNRNTVVIYVCGGLIA